MRCVVGIVAVGVLLANPAFADAPGWAALSRFVGTYPAAGFMKSGLVQGEINPLLAPKQRALLGAMAVSPPISRVGNDLLVQFCMPHACGTESAVIVADQVGRRMWVGFYRDHGKAFSMEWVGTDDPAAIPHEVLNQLAKIHNPF